MQVPNSSALVSTPVVAGVSALGDGSGLPSGPNDFGAPAPSKPRSVGTAIVDAFSTELKSAKARPEHFLGHEVGTSSAALTERALIERLERALADRFGSEAPIVTASPLGVLVGVKTQRLDPRDPLVVDVPERRDANACGVRWEATLTGMLPHLGPAVEIGPIDLAATYREGLRVWQVVPGVEDARRSLSVPFDGEAARRLAPGSEVVVFGLSSAKQFAELRVTSPTTTFTVGGVAGARVDREAGQEVGIRIRRLGGDEVEVSLSRIAQSAKAAEVFAGVQPTFGVPEAAASWFEELEIDRLNKIAKWLALEVHAELGRFAEQGVVDALRIDLGDENGRRAYEAMLRLEVAEARRHARRGRAVLDCDRLRESTDGKTSGMGLRFGPLELMVSERSKQSTEGRYSWLSRGAIPPGFDTSTGAIETERGRVEFVRATRAKRTGGLLLQAAGVGDAKLLQEILYLKPSLASGGEPRAYFRHRFSLERDLFPTRRDFDFLLKVARGFGLASGLEENQELPKAGLFSRSDRAVDFIWTDTGLRRMIDRRDELDRAYAEAFRDWDQPPPGSGSWTEFAAPWQNRDDPNFGAVMELLEAGPDLMNENQERYKKLTGRDLEVDGLPYRELRDLKRFLDDVGGRPGVDVAAILADLDSIGLSWRAIFALTALAGREETIVNQISLGDGKGRIVDLHDDRAITELRVQDPLRKSSGVESMDPRHILRREIWPRQGSADTSTRG